MPCWSSERTASIVVCWAGQQQRCDFESDAIKMAVLTYDVVEKVKEDRLASASITDFKLGPAVMRHQPSFLVASAAVSPYCVDPARDVVVLVELPSGLDISAAPFVYEMQYSAALRVHTMPIDEFCTLTSTINPIAHPVLLHSTGRCGSTLLVRALGEAPGVTSFSEPDIFTQLATAGTLPSAAIAHFEALYRACLLFFMRDRVGAAVFKLRAAACQHAVHLASAVPGASSVFLYRDAVEVARSYARLTGRSLAAWRLDEGQRRAWSRFAPLVFRLEGAIDGYDLMAALWAGPVLRYIELQPSGMWRGAVDYAEVLAQPHRVAEAILGDVGSSSEPLRLSLNGFRRHSQADSHLAPDTVVVNDALEAELASPCFANRIESSLRRIDPALRADMTLPGRLLA